MIHSAPYKSPNFVKPIFLAKMNKVPQTYQSIIRYPSNESHSLDRNEKPTHLDRQCETRAKVSRFARRLPIGKMIRKIREGLERTRGERFARLRGDLHVYVPELIASEHRRTARKVGRGENKRTDRQKGKRKRE